MENINNGISFILNTARKYVEDLWRGVPYLEAKVKVVTKLLYWITLKKKAKGANIDRSLNE